MNRWAHQISENGLYFSKLLTCSDKCAKNVDHLATNVYVLTTNLYVLVSPMCVIRTNNHNQCINTRLTFLTNI